MTWAPRPQIHFTPMRNWMNDPNGLLYYKGLYHLFFQYNPEGDKWGNMSWGHAISENLIDWKEQPVAIAYTSTHAIFSGSAVVDYFNTTGFGTLDNPAMVAIYTAHKHDESHQAQALAYSLDEGLTWVKYEGNPVLDLEIDHFRDPKVSWDGTSESWLMTVVLPKQRKVSFYSSKNLINWTHLSDFGPFGAIEGDWECPDLFPLFVDEDEKKVKWVLLISINPGGLTGGSGTQYFIGDWTGNEFVASNSGTNWLDHGRDNYAGVTFNDAPNQRRIFLGWMSNWEYAKNFPTSLWRGSMTLPRELSLISQGDRILLAMNPVVELNDYLGEKLSEGGESELLQIEATISTREGLATKFRVTADAGSYFEFGYDAKSESIFIDRSKAWNEIPSSHIHSVRYSGDAETFDICAVVERGSVEIFAAGGTYALTDLLFLPGERLRVSFEINDECQPPRSIAVRPIAVRPLAL